MAPTTDTEHASSARPMRRSHREVTDARELKDILERAHVVRVGYEDTEGIAVVPVNFGLEWDVDVPGTLPVLWVHSAGEGRKADAWSASPQVALELDVEGGVTTGSYACAYSYAYESIMAWGRVSPVTDATEKLRGLSLIMAHMAPGAPVTFSDEAVARVAVWRIDVERLTGKRREGTPMAAGQGKPEAAVPAGKDGVELAAAGQDRPVRAEADARGASDALPSAAETTAEPPANVATPDVPAPDAPSVDAPKKARRHSSIADRIGLGGKHGKGKGHKGKHKGKGTDAAYPCETVDDKASGKTRDEIARQLDEVLEGKLGKPSKKGKKAEKKARERRIEEALAGERCPGCGRHCKLESPHCGKGKKLRAKRLEQAGIRE